MILSNQARCKHCGDEPYSMHRHDFQTCSCASLSVDGGMDYLRRVGAPEDCIDMSIVISQDHYDGLLEAMTDPTKNDLGKICNIVRYLRDEMNINVTDMGEEDDDEH